MAKQHDTNKLICSEIKIFLQFSILSCYLDLDSVGQLAQAPPSVPCLANLGKWLEEEQSKRASLLLFPVQQHKWSCTHQLGHPLIFSCYCLDHDRPLKVVQRIIPIAIQLSRRCLFLSFLHHLYDGLPYSFLQIL